MSKAHLVPSSSKQPIPSGTYLIHKSTQVIFLSPSCSPWLVHLKMGDRCDGKAVPNPLNTHMSPEWADILAELWTCPAEQKHPQWIFQLPMTYPSQVTLHNAAFTPCASEREVYNWVSSRTNKAALGISAKPTLTQRLSTNSQWYMGTPGHSRPQPALTVHSLKFLSLLTHLDYSPVYSLSC